MRLSEAYLHTSLGALLWVGLQAVVAFPKAALDIRCKTQLTPKEGTAGMLLFSGQKLLPGWPCHCEDKSPSQAFCAAPRERLGVCFPPHNN